jgi:tetratricopeptide (TPR) repeat protein
MNPWSSLSLVFQAPSLLLVALSSVLLAFMLGRVPGPFSVFFILPIWMMLTWILKYGLALLDAAANGERQAPVASTEMMGPFGDARAWAFPLMAGLVALAAWRVPPLRVALPAIALALLPLSLAAMAVSDRLLDAFNPVAWWKAMSGLGAAWPVLAAAFCLMGLAGYATWRSALHPVVDFGVIELLFLCAHALTGGVVHARRHALGFSPRHSPERTQETADAARDLDRQRVFDEVYAAVRVRRDDQAIATLDRWLANCDARQAEADIGALVAAGARWNEPRGYGAVLRHLIGLSCERRRPAQALAIVEHALALSPRFAPEPPDQVVAIARYAAQTSRRRTALQLLDNALATAPPDSRPMLEALQRELAR